MKLTELYASLPAEKHGNIKVFGERVIVRSPDGYDEYILDADGELWLARSNRQDRQDIAQIKEKLGIAVSEGK